ncbi:POTRA domain-containing protein [Erwinia aphidicola]|uniref:POTRA domain-containing protein n=1 Tax=Erwinia aphidicola TaxID=68334 RepID=UPI003AFAA582
MKFIRADSLSEKDKAALVRPFVGRCLTMSNIMQLQSAATNRWFHHLTYLAGSTGSDARNAGSHRQ